MSSALLGILQLDRGLPNGLAQLPGLIQSWLQDAGGFAMVGLLVYLGYAFLRPTDKSESEKLRVPVSGWMVWMAALALLTYSLVGATLFTQQASINLGGKSIAIAPPELPPPDPSAPVVIPPPTFRTELRPLLLMFAGLFALLGLGQPFIRDMARIRRRNLSFSLTSLKRFAHGIATYFTSALTARRVTILGIVFATYAVLGAVLWFSGGSRLFDIWTDVCIVAATLLLLAFLTLMLFEAEGPLWAVAKLSFKEAVRSQFLWVLLIVFLPFLFPSQWFRQFKPADELRMTVRDIFFVLTFLVLFPAVLLASFGIPNDIKNLNIYTVVSKPVERFEIVLGRFVGYVALMTLVLIGLTGATLVLVRNTSISEKAREETYKARVPVRGKLEFKSLQAQFRQDKVEFAGTNVGREFDYRKYIAGHPKSPQRAIWQFTELPSDLGRAAGDRIPVEFTFDIFKLTKGEQNKGATVRFWFVSHQTPQEQPIEVRENGEWLWVDKEKQRDYRELVDKFQAGGVVQADEAERFRKLGGTVNEVGGRLELVSVNLDKPKPGTQDWAVASKLAEQFGIFEVGGKEVLDYTVMSVEIPAGLVRNALQGDPGKDAGKARPRLSVYVKCESPGQLLGMAEPDLYLLEYERPFWTNYVKGMFGLWCRLCILVGIAVAFSTYLSGVLSLLAAVVIFSIGFFSDHLNDMATNRNVGGGPFQSMSQILKAEQPTTPLQDTAGVKTILVADKGSAWLFRRVQNVVPDVESLGWRNFVAEGFNINGDYLFVNLLVTMGYLLPWGIFAYYMMKFREVAA